jgi:uncharacterized protein (TIGR00159 family)
LETKELFQPVRIADIIDIAVISVLLYFCIVWLKQRASRSLAVGIGLISLLYICAQRFDMFLTSWLFRAGFTAVLIALVIVFQTDIRRAIERFATWSSLRTKHRSIASMQTSDTIIEAVQKLAENKIGALLAFKGREPLDRHIRGGVSLNGRISYPLLYGLFNTASPTHDGAVIIEGEWIDRFAVYLPLSQHVKEGSEAGTRHAAGVGLSEACDAFVIIVSEERGTISVAEHGRLDLLSSPAVLKERLDKFYHYLRPKNGTTARFKRLRHNIGAKMLSLFLASALWIFFAFRAETIHRTFTVPVEWRNLPPNFIIDNPKPTEVRVSLSGTERELSGETNAMVISLDLGSLHDGTQDIPVNERAILNKPSGTEIHQVEPRTIKLRAYSLVEMELPVKIRMEKSLIPQLKMLSATADPERVKVLAPQERKEDFLSIHTAPVDLDEVTQSATIRTKLVLPDQVQLAGGSVMNVKVRIEVEDRGKKTK